MEQPGSTKIKIPPSVTKYLSPNSPKEARMMAARGMVPMAPAVLVTALTYFLGDSDAEVKEAARKSLMDLPPNLALNVLKEPIHPKALDFFGRERSSDEKILELILLNNQTPDETFAFLAQTVGERFTQMIASNQVRLLRTPAIAEGLKKNHHALRSTLDTMVSFLRISGVVLEGESPELTAEEIRQIINTPESEGVVEFAEELLKEIAPDDQNADQKKKTIYQMIINMAVAHKVKLALKGNKEARSLLIKDSNKIVASAVIKNPGISDGEVIAVANSRTAHDDVIRIISGDPTWVKSYTMQVALANNPKTPFPIALKFVRQLRVSDLKKLVGNKNIPNQLAKLAKELYETKRV